MACSCNKGFAVSHMLLNPKAKGFLNLARLLYSSNLEKCQLVECPEGTVVESFRHRLLILMSILLQKFLQFVAKPLALFGSIVELLLNWDYLVSSNHNVFMLILNFLRYKVVMPDKTSPKFLSFVGYLDKRVTLDSSIKHEDIRYNAALSIMASKASYENAAYIETAVKDHWKMEFVGSHDYWNAYQGKATTRAFILLEINEDHHTYVVAFRGTQPFNADEWCTDIDISWYEFTDVKKNRVGKIHAGFMKALGLQSNEGWPTEIEKDKSHPPFAYYAIRDILRERLRENANAKFIVTGHSLGGALAILFAAVLFLHDDEFLLKRLEGIYTFGQPRVGDEAFAEYMEKKLESINCMKYYRFVYCNDVVPRLPYDDKNFMFSSWANDKNLIFKHFGTCLYFNRRYEGKIQEAPNMSYLSPLAGISMMMNAFWELIRSFTIAFQYGSDYKEGWLLKFFRIVGLVFPGLAAHLPQDYVNAIRLASVPPHVD